MSERRPSEIVNPVQTLRDWRAAMAPERRADPEAAQAAFSLLTLSELRSMNDRLIWQPISHNTPETIVQLWLANQELTRRGVAPRWRRLPTYIAPEAAPNIPDALLKPGEPRPLSHACRKRALLRWIDLEWLSHELGHTHRVDHAHWRGVFRWGLDEKIAAKIANSPLKPSRLNAYIDIPAPHRYVLTGLLAQDSAKRIRNIKEKRLDRAQWMLDARPLLTDTQRGSRVAWVQAIELAEGSPTVAATVYGWITGETVTKQSAAEMRNKLAQQLGFVTAIWRPK